MDPEKSQAIINKLHEEYSDFGPTLASEKLWEQDQLKVSKEPLRQLMIAEKLHHPKPRKEDRVRQMRERKRHRGELVQIDGSLIIVCLTKIESGTASLNMCWNCGARSFI